MSERTKIVNSIVLKEKARKFTEYVHANDNNNNPISFKDPNGILAIEEGYKEQLAKDAREILKSEEWDESWIGSGRIKDLIYKVMSLQQNFVNFNTVTYFKNRFLNENIPIAERAIYDIYRGSDEKAAFNLAKEFFGAKYSLLAYLFYIKDETRFLPTSPTNFERCFEQLGINYKMSFQCSWENYCTYIDIIREIGVLLTDDLELSHELSLLDVHSFVWIIGEKVFMEWCKENADINTPISPKRIITNPDGTVKYVCGRCDYSFFKVSRCPECGQLVKE